MLPFPHVTFPSSLHIQTCCAVPLDEQLCHTGEISSQTIFDDDDFSDEFDPVSFLDSMKEYIVPGYDMSDSCSSYDYECYYYY
jgi:hypothetical protein